MKDRIKGFFLGATTVTVVAVGIAIMFAKSVSDALDKAFADSLFNLVEENAEPQGEGMIAVVIAGKEAFWIHGQSLMVAPVTGNEEVQFDEAKEFDAMSAPRSELAKMLYIVDSLREE